MITSEYIQGARLGNHMFTRAMVQLFSKQTGMAINDQSTPETVMDLIDSKYIHDTPSTQGDGSIDITITDPEVRSKTSYLRHLRHPNYSHIHINGYFQKSWLYLEDREYFKKFYNTSDILNKANIPEPVKEDVAVCIRRGDLGCHSHLMPMIIPLSYYDHVIAGNFNNKNLHIFTDSPNCADVLALKEKYSVVYCTPSYDNNDKNWQNSPDELTDLSRITKFQNIIGGTGTFHWWGIFLSNAKNIFLPLHNSGWGIGAGHRGIDLYLPFVKYIHHTSYLP